jgi:serine/threonine protein kinase
VCGFATAVHEVCGFGASVPVRSFGLLAAEALSARLQPVVRQNQADHCTVGTDIACIGPARDNVAQPGGFRPMHTLTCSVCDQSRLLDGQDPAGCAACPLGADRCPKRDRSNSNFLPNVPAPGHATARLRRPLLPYLAPPVEEDDIGRLAEYRIVTVLGMGGMGVVFCAHDTTLDRRVAVKVIHPALAGDEEVRQRFLREARAAAAVEHDHIVPVYHCGRAGDVLFLVMPLLAGESLADLLAREGRLSWRATCRIGRQVGEGLDAIHDAGLIHRDIKPGNIWLQRRRSGSPRVRILDLGLARAIDGRDRITFPGAVVGTLAFMAPEQARGEELDARADLFALGCVLYRMLTGYLPFRMEHQGQIPQAALELPPVAPALLARDVPADLSDLVLELLCNSREGRPGSARAVALRLAAIKQGERWTC